jgi:hypothetical protein
LARTTQYSFDEDFINHKRNNFIPLRNSSNQSLMGAPMRESKRNHIYGDIKQETKSNVGFFSPFQMKKG